MRTHAGAQALLRISGFTSAAWPRCTRPDSRTSGLATRPFPRGKARRGLTLRCGRFLPTPTRLGPSRCRSTQTSTRVTILAGREVRRPTAAEANIRNLQAWLVALGERLAIPQRTSTSRSCKTCRRRARLIRAAWLPRSCKAPPRLVRYERTPFPTRRGGICEVEAAVGGWRSIRTAMGPTAYPRSLPAGACRRLVV